MLSTLSAPPATAYDEDYVQWIEEQASLLSTIDFPALDVINLADEIRDMARHERRSLRHRLTVLVMHMLKCQMQPEHKSDRWRATLHEQRARIAELLSDSPSLKALIPQFITDDYVLAVKKVAAETGLDRSRFPPQNPFTIEQILDINYEP